MGTFFALARRELGVYFISPMAYVLMTLFLGVSGLFFWTSIQEDVGSRVPVSIPSAVFWIYFINILICPFLTMRLLAEEKNRGTLEMLMTAPLGEWVVVLAKYAASLVFYLLILIPTSFFFIYLSLFMTLDRGEVIGVYLAFLLLTASVLAIGLFISSLCANQATAGVITLVINLVFILMAFVERGVPRDSLVRDVIGYANFLMHSESFIYGVVDTRDVVFFLSIVVLFLFWTVRVVESRRWK